MKVRLKRHNNYENKHSIGAKYKYMEFEKLPIFKNKILRFIVCIPSYFMYSLRYVWHRYCYKDQVIVHEYDTYSADHTLAQIIYPVLKQLHDNKHGAPDVEDDDVPDTVKNISVVSHGTDYAHFLKWEYVMNMMLFSFDCVNKNADFGQPSYPLMVVRIPNVADICKKYPNAVTPTLVSLEKEHGKDAIDKLCVELEYTSANTPELMSEGFRLFGKYYTSLWD